ncbi:MAG: GIN domain-containing protein [Hyphomicrobiales bacterium]
MKKKNLLSLSLLIIFCLFGLNQSVEAQTGNDRGYPQKQFDVTDFNKIIADGIIKIEYTPSEEYNVTIESEQKVLDNIEIMIRNNTLDLRDIPYKKVDYVKAYISSPSLEEINLQGVASFKVLNTVLQQDYLLLKASGATEIDASIEINRLDIRASGASNIDMSGTANEMDLNVSGAAVVDLRNAKAKTAAVDASGASYVGVNSETFTSLKETGVANVSYNNDANVINYDKKEDIRDTYHRQKRYYRGTRNRYYRDTTNIRLNDFGISVIEGDSTIIQVGKRKLIVDEFGNVKFTRNRNKFDGHFAGVEIGLNGFVNKDFNMNLDKADSYLNLRLEKSVNVNINFVEYNIPISKNQKWGFITGLSMGIHNYRFSNRGTYLVPDSSSIKGYYIDGASVKKSKIVNTYINVPVLFEFQTNGKHYGKGFHIQAGVMFGARLQTHTKNVFSNDDERFDLVDPVTGGIVASSRVSNKKYKQHDSFHMNPFKFDASFRIGYGLVNLYATYSLTPLFKKDQGPELYPFSIGISLIGWSLQ